MKTLKTSFASRVRLYQGTLTAIMLASLVVHSEAQITNITKSANGNISNLGFDPNNGLYYWTIDGVNQLNQESFYFNLGSGVTELNSSMITSETVTKLGGSSYNELELSYNLGSGFTANFTYVLGIAGNNYSLTPTIYIYNNNLSGSANISFYQFSNFVLGNAPGSQNVQMSIINPGNQYQAYQTGGGVSLTDLVQPITPITGVTFTTEMQADSGAPFGPSNVSANPLNTNPLVAGQLTGSGSVDFAYEWDATGLQAGTSFSISQAQTITVPEPSSVALIASGMFALALVSGRQRSKKT